MYKKFVFLCAAAILTGCVAMQIDSTILKYELVADQVELGDSKEKVLAILEPTQDGLPNSARKNHEKYLKDGVKVEIYYMRSARQPDDLTTDDEFVPYLFNDGKLVGIGWAALGGAKTQGQAVPRNVYTPSNTNRKNQQILNHGAGGCTPNFSTGGCL